MVWLNLDSKREIEELYHHWREAGAKILAEPEDEPWHLRGFRVADLDGNQLRVVLRLFMGVVAGAAVGKMGPHVARGPSRRFS